MSDVLDDLCGSYYLPGQFQTRKRLKYLCGTAFGTSVFSCSFQRQPCNEFRYPLGVSASIGEQQPGHKIVEVPPASIRT